MKVCWLGVRVCCGTSCSYPTNPGLALSQGTHATVTTGGRLAVAGVEYLIRVSSVGGAGDFTLQGAIW